jgi:Arc/MetJ-type ribon-helix-helix transcriptional regulator
MRINARLEDSYETKFMLVQQQEYKNRTDILKEALDEYFARKLQQEEQSAWEKNQRILKMLAGIGSGPEDLSTNYKDYLYRGLKEKYGLD